MTPSSDSAKDRRDLALRILDGVSTPESRQLAYLFTTFLDDLEDVCGSDGKEMVLIRMKLEECVMLAKQMVATQP